MPYKKILLATDGSAHAMHAAAQAAQLAKDTGASVEVLGIAVVHPMYGGLHLGSAAGSIEAEAEKAAADAVNDTAKVLRDAGVPVTTVVSVAMGNAGAAICKEAEESGADLLVIGSRGLGPTGSLIMGSVSQHVVHCSKLPVLVVR